MKRRLKTLRILHTTNFAGLYVRFQNIFNFLERIHIRRYRLLSRYHRALKVLQ